MNEEEKKAIRNLENLSEYGLSTTLNQADLDKMKIVLNLITKLQKENEELKKQNEELYKLVKLILMQFGTKEIEVPIDDMRKIDRYELYIEESYMKYAKRIKLIDRKQIWENIESGGGVNGKYN